MSEEPEAPPVEDVETAAEEAAEEDLDEAEPEDPPESWRGRLLENLIPSLVKRALKEGGEALGDEKLRETVVAEVLRKAISKGAEVYDTTEDSLRRTLADLSLPKEAVEKIVDRFDTYRGELFRAIREEVHEWLDRVDIGQEVQKILTSLSFEISTEMRFIPNEKGVQPRPEVKAGVRVKRTRKRDDES